MIYFPVGTILRVNDHKVCVIGYASDKKDETETAGYLTVLYPLGFTGVDKVFFLPADRQYTVVACGYETKASEQILETVRKGFETVKHIPRKDLVRLTEALKETLSSNERGEKI